MSQSHRAPQIKCWPACPSPDHWPFGAIFESIDLVLPKMNVKLKKLSSVKDGTGHSIFGASGSKMFLHCAGSLIPNLLAPDEGSKDAAIGTVAHEIAECWLRHGKRAAFAYLGRVIYVPGGEWGYAIKVDREMMSYVWDSVMRFEMVEGDRLVESHVDYSDLTPIPNQGGTLDLAVMRMGWALVGDHKFGKGERIYAKWNPQLLLYAYGLLREWDWLYNFKSFTLTIHQPRLDNFSTWECSRDELLMFVGWAKARMHAAWDLHAERNPSPEACAWCKVRGDCAPYAKMMLRLLADFTDGVFDQENTVEAVQEFKAQIESDEIVMNDFDPMRLTTAHMAALVKYRLPNEKWWTAMIAELMRRRAAGQPVPGHKLVEGRTHRYFRNEREAIEALVKLGIPRSKVELTSTVSPAEAEKLIIQYTDVPKKELGDLMAPLVAKPRGKPTLVPDADRRQELVDASNVEWDNDADSETADY